MRIGLPGVFVLACTTLMWGAGDLMADICNHLAATGSPLAVPLFIGSAAAAAVAIFAATWMVVRVLNR